MPEVGIALAVLLALGLGVRSSWVWLFRGRRLVTPWRGTLGSVVISLVLPPPRQHVEAAGNREICSTSRTLVIDHHS